MIGKRRQCSPIVANANSSSDWMAPSTMPVAQGLSCRLARVAAIHTKGILCTALTPAVIGGMLLAIGYFLGSSTRRLAVVAPEEDGDEVVEEVSDGDLSAITPGFTEPCKMVGHFFSGWCLRTQNILGARREDRSENDKRKNSSTVGHLALCP